MPQDPSPPSGQALAPGTRLEEFEVESVLGRGGFGITYLAQDTSLGRRVVIKENLPAMFAFRDSLSGTVCPQSEVGEDADNFDWSMQSFLREAETLASLDHPGIVKVLRKFEANGTAYFVMPFEEGTALDDLLKKSARDGGFFDERKVTVLLEHVLDALGYMHAHEICHRDIKPGNLLILNDGRPILIDFGSARQRLIDRSMTVVESAGYTPFEQLQSRGNVGPWSDLYALGATMAKVVAGELPPKAADRILDDPWQPLSARPELAQRYSRGLLESIDRALAPGVSDRMQDAKEWLGALKAGEPVRKNVAAILPAIPLAMPEEVQVSAPVGAEDVVSASGLMEVKTSPATPVPPTYTPQAEQPEIRSGQQQDPLQIPVATPLPASSRESLAGNRKVQLIAGSVLAVVLLVVVLMMVSQSNHEEELARIAGAEQQDEEERKRREAARQKAQAELVAEEERKRREATRQKAQAERKRREVAVSKAMKLFVRGERFPANFLEHVDRDDLRAAADNGDADGQFIWGRIHHGVFGVLGNDAQAVKWYRKAADQGHAFAQFSLGEMFADANNDGEAAKWFRKAADQGDAIAQVTLAEVYRKGKGVVQDDAEARKWYLTAAEKGNVDAQFLLGLMCDTGRGGTIDEAEAVKWYRKAADQGHQEAKEVLREAEEALLKSQL